MKFGDTQFGVSALLLIIAIIVFVLAGFDAGGDTLTQLDLISFGLVSFCAAHLLP